MPGLLKVEFAEDGLKFNSNDSAENLKAKFESLIAENKSIVSQKSSIETILKTTIESIDTSKIG